MKSLCLVAASALCLFSACTNPQSASSSSDQSMAQKNLDAVHIVNKAFETGDVSHIDDAVAADFVDHTERGERGRDSLKVMITQMHNTLKDMKAEILKEVADNDYVFQMMRYTGTGDGVMMPPGPYDMHSVEVIRLKDGKGVEHWGFADMGEMMKMMSKQGASGEMPSPAKADTTVMHK